MYLRNGVWYFRRRIPKDLLEHYSPKLEFNFSLKTGNKAEAERLARKESVNLDNEFQLVRCNASAEATYSISKQDIKNLTDAWIVQLLEEDEEWRIEGMSDRDYRRMSETLGIVEAGGKDAFAKGDKSLIEFEMEDFCESNGYKIIKDSPAYNQLAYAFLRASVEVNNKLRLRHKGEIVDTPEAPILNPLVLSNYMDSFEKLRDYWLSQDKKSRTAGAEANTIIKKFREFVGDLKPSEVTKHHIVELKDRMLEAGSAPATINKGRGMLAAIFSNAYKNAKVETNPFDGMEKLKIPRKEADSPYTINELQIIFNSPVFKDGVRPTQGKEEAAFWMPLIGLYSGARLNEIAQIYMDDIGAEDDINYFLIRPEEATGRTVKDGNKRRVPLHPDLIRMGFLEYVAKMRQEKQTQLFPALKVTREDGKLADKWGRWWSSYIRSELNIDRIPQPFHGLRHTFTENGRRCNMGHEARMRIEGHSMNTVGDKAYGNTLFPLEPLYEEIQKLTFKGLNLSHLFKS